MPHRRRDPADGGKTGTSQVRNITAAERARGVFRNEDLPWERRDHALFVCFAPLDAPRYAVAVVVEHGGGGSTAAARSRATSCCRRCTAATCRRSTAYPSGQRDKIREMQKALPLRPAAPEAPTRSRA